VNVGPGDGLGVGITVAVGDAVALDAGVGVREGSAGEALASGMAAFSPAPPQELRASVATSAATAWKEQGRTASDTR
jgi:hypothetical protein